VRRFLLLFLVLLSACALIEKKETKVEWPSRAEYLEGMGVLDMNWKGTAYSGSASVKMEYPDLLVLEVYGAFGQTLMYLKKGPDGFIFAGDGKIEDQRFFEDRYGLRLVQFMDDLALVGERKSLPGGFAIQRIDYRVIYDSDSRGRSRICWREREGHICLAFDEISFTQGEPAGEGGSGGH